MTALRSLAIRSGGRRLAPLATFMASAAVASLGAACSRANSAVSVRSLERSGQMSFLCLSNSQPTGVPLGACTNVRQDLYDFSQGPHLYAMIAQTQRGELAVVDVTASQVVDTDPSLPGYSFLPVGAQPVDVVSTPGSTATFVAVAERGKEGIFAIPSSQIARPGQVVPVASLTSFPSCRLPGAPGKIALLLDRQSSRDTRRSCGESVPAASGATDMGDAGTPTEGGLANAYEPPGVKRLLVTLPDRGEVVLVDVQKLLLDPAYHQFADCPIDVVSGHIPLQVDLTPSSPGAAEVQVPTEPSPPSAICNPKIVAEPRAISAEPHPASVAVADDGRVYISDDRAPVIHVLDATDPCAVRELSPLLPQSVTEPSRTVVTDAIAVSPLTRDGKQFVYAVDLKQGSVMAFDVSDSAPKIASDAGAPTNDAGTSGGASASSVSALSRAPLRLADAEQSPYDPIDRLALHAPARGITFVRRELVLTDPAIAPDAGFLSSNQQCDPSVNNDLLQSTLQPAADLSSGAGPTVLRGIFATIALASGEIMIVDVDDFDSECRGPSNVPLLSSPLLGCAATRDANHYLHTSNEVSCNAVERHRPRSLNYYLTSTQAGRHSPSMVSLPTLVAKDNSTLSNEKNTFLNPKMLGPAGVFPSQPNPDFADPRVISAGVHLRAQDLTTADVPATAVAAVSSSDPADPNLARHNWVAFDVREPRNHVDQRWTAAYEGVIPGSSLKKGVMRCWSEQDRQAFPQENVGPSSGTAARQVCAGEAYELYDPSASFCDLGARGSDAAASDDGVHGLPGDLVELSDNVPAEDDLYWQTVTNQCSYVQCAVTFGLPPTPTAARDYDVLAAYQDHLVLRPHPVIDATSGRPLDVRCCFPTAVSYNVRASRQWVVVGSNTGFLHHVTAGDDGHCADSCDPSLGLKTGRAQMIEGTSADGISANGMKQPSEPIRYDDPSVLHGAPRLFRNAQVQFVIWKGSAEAKRDSVFSFQEVGGFVHYGLSLNVQGGAIVPNAMVEVPPLNQLAVTDATSDGLLLVDFALRAVDRAIY